MPTGNDAERGLDMEEQLRKVTSILIGELVHSGLGVPYLCMFLLA